MAAKVVEIVPSTIAHVYALAAKMRADDAQEAMALGGTPKRMLRSSFKSSVIARTAFVDGEIAAMWGMQTSLLSDIGVPWLVTTKAVERAQFTFARQGREEVAAMLELRPYLENFVAANYARAVRFIQVMGFNVDDRVQNGFRHFWIGAR